VIPDVVRVLIPILAVFVVMTLAAARIGTLFAVFHLPLITGFLAAGFFCGPDMLRLIDRDAVTSLAFINQIALAVIAFAAGNELLLKEYRDRFRSISWVTTGQIVVTMIGGSAVMYVLTSYMPILQDQSEAVRLAVSGITATILLASSPSSAIAIVNELRAKGPVTQTVLGVTVIKDVIVIMLFAICVEFAHAAVSPETSIDAGFLFLLLLELSLSVVIGCVLWKLLVFILAKPMHQLAKGVLMVAVGFGTFVGAEWLEGWTHAHMTTTIFIEPLLICMIAGILVTNFSNYRSEFSRVLFQVGPPVYLAFFTLTGAAVDLGVLAQAWQVAFVLLAVRMLSLVVGSYLGGLAAGDSPRDNGITWLGFVTQAGVGIGLASGIAAQVEFSWGRDLATLLIAVIIINQVIGPPLFKWAIAMAGEQREHAAGTSFAGSHIAVILGHKTGQPLMLAQRLVSHGWDVTLVVDGEVEEEVEDPDITLVTIPELSEQALEPLELSRADALISLLTDEENVQICNLNYDKFGVKRLIVRLEDSLMYGKTCHELGALVMCPKTSIVSLLEHFVTSPTATSILLDLDPEQEVIEVEVLDRTLDGIPIRDLKLPHSVLILSVTRDGHALVSHGYVTLKMGDRLTVVGPPDVLPYAAIYFDR